MRMITYYTREVAKAEAALIEAIERKPEHVDGARMHLRYMNESLSYYERQRPRPRNTEVEA